MKTTVIGAGAWGTAFAAHLARTGKEVMLWVYEKELFDLLVSGHDNTLYLPGFILPKSIRFTVNLEEAAGFSDDIVIAVPSFALRSTIGSAASQLACKNLLILTKGIERETFLCMNEVAEEILGKESASRIATLSGPSFAKEVAQQTFTAAVVASKNRELVHYFQKLIHDKHFRVYASDDIIGVELGGSLKNIMAIGAGIIEGLRFGTNTQAAFLTRALAEMKRLGKALGAKETTFMGLSGMGDLILTSYGNLSRNRLFGIELAKGDIPAEIIEKQKNVVEGYYCINAVYNLSRKLGVEMPITEELYKITYEGKNIQASMKDLIQREFKEEDYG